MGRSVGEVGEGMGVIYGVVGDFEAAEGGKVGAGTEALTDVFGESADIGARGAVDAEF